MTPDTSRDTGHDKAATTPDVSRPDVLTVAQAAQLLGVSARTVQRQCRAGKLRATRLETEFGEQWKLDRAHVEKAATGAATTPRQEPRQGDDTPATEAATHPRHVAPQAPDFAARYVAQIEAENAFLRAAVEQHQRSEAELRAALREALKAQPRQLEQGHAAPEVAQERAPTTPTTGTASPTPEAVNAPLIAPEMAGTTRSAARSILRALLGLR